MTANPFEVHGITHLSNSTVIQYVTSPALFVMEKLLAIKIPVGPAAPRGTAVEDGVIAALRGIRLEDAVTIAENHFDALTIGFDPDDAKIQKERSAIAGMVKQGVTLLSPYGWPDRTQARKTWSMDGIEIPFIGYSDAEWDTLGVIADLKTVSAMPATPKDAHLRQVSCYIGAGGNWRGELIYLTTKKGAVYPVTDVAGHIRTLERMAHALRRFLSISNDPYELASLVVPDTEHWLFADPHAREAAREVYGV